MTHTDALPPMPDRQTGQPRPPRAPARKIKGDYTVPWHPRHVPQPSSEEGRVLEWCYPRRGEQFTQFAVMTIVGIVFASIIDGGLGWMRTWWLWVVVLAGGLLLLLAARTHRYSAGADWYLHRKDFVKTYELASIKFDKNFGDGNLHLADRHGGKARVDLTWIRSNLDLWDLVYNGIRHSVANGAYVNDQAISRLNLEDVVRMRDDRFRQPPAP